MGGEEKRHQKKWSHRGGKKEAISGAIKGGIHPTQYQHNGAESVSSEQSDSGKIKKKGKGGNIGWERTLTRGHTTRLRKDFPSLDQSGRE